MEHHDGHDQYSTLELYEPHILAEQYPTPLSPQAIPLSDRQTTESEQSPRNHDGLETLSAEHLAQRNGSHKQSVPDNTEGLWPQPAQESAPEEARAPESICGRERTKFLLCLLFVAFIVLGAVLGGVLGTQIDLNNEPAPDESDQTGFDSSAVQILDGSRLSATNWTGLDSVSHKAVFFQDEYEFLVARRWDSVSKTWSTTNITDIVLKEDAAATKPRRGSTLASNSKSLRVNGETGEMVYFLNSETSIRSYWTKDMEDYKSEWQVDTLDGWNGFVYPESELAATYDHIGNHVYTILACQNTEGNIIVNNSSQWGITTDPAVFLQETAQRPTPITMAPYLNGTDEGVALVWQNEYSQMDHTYRTPATVEEDENSWRDEGGHYLMEDLKVAHSMREQHFAVSKMANWSKAMWFARTNNGTILGSWSDGGADPVEFTISFNDVDDETAQAWGSIAAAHGGLFFGITEGRILEYQILEDNPGVLQYSSTVYP